MNDQHARLGKQLCQQGIRLITAESCTAGMVAATLGDIEGCGEWLEGAFVSYTEKAKQVMLGVSPDDMSRYGLTSEEIARKMAEGAFAGSAARLAISNTGVAGPDDAPDGTKAGTVCFAWLYQRDDRAIVRTATMHFSGDRLSVRRQATDYSIQQALRLLESESEP
jgi:nicotinamide-nucleotide amidase